jgi:hypothetical protein
LSTARYRQASTPEGDDAQKNSGPSRSESTWPGVGSCTSLAAIGKLLVRYEKLDRSFLALNHLAAAITAFRKVPLSVNKIYG